MVVYTTTLGIVRDTYERCLRIRKILWTLLVRFEERDVFMARDTQLQLLDRLHSPNVSVPHVFLEGQYLGVSHEETVWLRYLTVSAISLLKVVIIALALSGC